MSDEEKKKKEAEYLKNWQGNPMEKMQKGFAESKHTDEKDAWESIKGLFVPSAYGKKKKD